MTGTSKTARVALVACIAIAAAGAALAQQPSASNSLQQLDYAVLPAGRIVMKLAFRNEIRERPSVIAGYYPAANIVLDFGDTASELPSERAEIGHRVARSLQVLTAGGRTRVVINLNRPVSYDLVLAGREVLLTLDPRTGN